MAIPHMWLHGCRLEQAALSPPIKWFDQKNPLTKTRDLRRR